MTSYLFLIQSYDELSVLSIIRYGIGEHPEASGDALAGKRRRLTTCAHQARLVQKVISREVLEIRVTAIVEINYFSLSVNSPSQHVK